MLSYRWLQIHHNSTRSWKLAWKTRTILCCTRSLMEKICIKGKKTTKYNYWKKKKNVKKNMKNSKVFICPGQYNLFWEESYWKEGLFTSFTPAASVLFWLLPLGCLFWQPTVMNYHLFNVKKPQQSLTIKGKPPWTAMWVWTKLAFFFHSPFYPS